jgi:hypothetical protein
VVGAGEGVEPVQSGNWAPADAAGRAGRRGEPAYTLHRWKEHEVIGHDQANTRMPVTPSPESERPDGLAFDVPKGTELPGVPVGHQTPADPDAARIEETVRETGERLSAGLAVPADDAQKASEPLDGRPVER